MKKLILTSLLAVVLSLLYGGAVGADEGTCVRIVIPVAHISVSIQPVWWNDSSELWGEPNHATAWYLAPDYPQEIYLHRDGLSSEPKPQDLIYLYKDWMGVPLQLRVWRTERIDAEDIDEVLKTGGDLFAIVTCEGATRRLIIWARIDRGPRVAYVDWGDNVSSIAKLYGTSIEAIRRANNLPNVNYIRQGTFLLVP